MINLPFALKHISFDDCFNQEINNLPPNITHISFGYNFRQKLDKLPHKLTHIELGCKYWNKINKLPAGITHMKLYYYNGEIDNFPPNIIEIYFGADSNPKKIITLNYFPESVERLIFEMHSDTIHIYGGYRLKQVDVDNIQKSKVNDLPRKCEIQQCEYKPERKSLFGV